MVVPHPQLLSPLALVRRLERDHRGTRGPGLGCSDVSAPPPTTRTTSASRPPIWKNCRTAWLIVLFGARPPKTRLNSAKLWAAVGLSTDSSENTYFEINSDYAFGLPEGCGSA